MFITIIPILFNVLVFPRAGLQSYNLSWFFGNFPACLPSWFREASWLKRR